MAQPTQAGQMTPLQLRANYLNLATKRDTELPPQAIQIGGVNLFVMPQNGVGRYIHVEFRGTLTRVGTADTIVASPFFPFNIINNVLLTDYAGISRVNAKPYHLAERMMTQKAGYDPSVNLQPLGVSAALLADFFSASIPATATSVPLNFGFDVPISLHGDTTEGSYPGAINGAQTTLSLQINALLNGSTIDSPWSGVSADTLTIAGTFNPTYYFFDAPAGTPLPLADFSTIHELLSIRQTTGINAGMNTDFILQTGRTYYQIIETLVLDNKVNTLSVDRFKLVVNSDINLVDENRWSYLTRLQKTYNRLMPDGVIVFGMFDKPLSPANYGSLNTSLAIDAGATIGTVAYLDVFRECQYTAQ